MYGDSVEGGEVSMFYAFIVYVPHAEHPTS